MKLVKEIDPSIVTVTGGIHPTLLSDQLIVNNNLDFIVLGEADFSMMALLQALEAGDMRKADGVVFRQSGSIKMIPKSGLIKDLDSIPFPARHLLPMNKYSEEGTPHGNFVQAKPFTAVMSSRGCALSCSFCSVRSFWGKNYRARSASNVVDEIEHLIADFGIREIHFEDDNLTADRKRAKELFSMIIERNIKISWATPTGIALYSLDDEMIELMKESGCYCLSLAVESGSQEVLNKIIKKPLKLDAVRKNIEKIKEVGLQTHAWFTIGYPDETPAQIYETVRYAKEIEVDYTTFYIVTPFPGSEIYEIARERGYIKEPIDWKKLELGKAMINTEHFSSEQIMRIRKDAWLYVNRLGEPSAEFTAVIAMR